VGERGEVVDDLGPRVADRGADRLGVEQVSLQPGRSRERRDRVSGVAARSDQMGAGEARRPGDKDPPGQG